MGPMFPKEMKYNLHYGKVRREVHIDPEAKGIKALFQIVSKVYRSYV